MEQENELNYNNGDVMIFDNFGDIFESSETDGQWKVKPSLTDLNAVRLLVCQRGTMKARIRDVEYEVGVGQGLVKNRKVDYFAQQLYITPKYLATLVRESNGKTPLEMIHRYTANMIAQRLRSTNMTIKEICTELEFPNESFFGRFVKKHLGCLPREYRDKMRKTKADES